MKSTSLLSFLLALFLLAGCGLNQEQKNKISELVRQGKIEIIKLKVTDSVFTAGNYDLNEEFADNLLDQNLANLHNAVQAMSSGGNFNNTVNNDLNEKLNRQNNLNKFQQNYITQTGEILGKYYLEILGVVKGSPIENNNEALKYTIFNQIPKDWHEITTQYISVQDTALAVAFSKVARTSLVRDNINGQVDIAIKFLDKVDVKARE